MASGNPHPIINNAPWNSESAREARSRPKRNWPKAVWKILKLQRLLESDMEKETTTPGERASLVRSWDVLEERKRVLKMIGSPKPVEASNQAVKASPAPIVTEQSIEPLRSVA